MFLSQIWEPMWSTTCFGFSGYFWKPNISAVTLLSDSFASYLLLNCSAAIWSQSCSCQEFLGEHYLLQLNQKRLLRQLQLLLQLGTLWKSSLRQIEAQKMTNLLFMVHASCFPCFCLLINLSRQCDNAYCYLSPFWGLFMGWGEERAFEQLTRLPTSVRNIWKSTFWLGCA